MHPDPGSTHHAACWSYHDGCEAPQPTVPRPSIDHLAEMHYGGAVEATDGCRVEPDGICEHGHPSWLLKEGLI